MRTHSRPHTTRPASLTRRTPHASRPLLETLESRLLLTVAPTLTTLIAFNSPYGNNPEALTADPAGNLYGCTAFGGTVNQGEVFQIAVGTSAFSILHTFNHAANITDGTSPYAALTRDAAGNLYGTTYGGGAHSFGTIFKIAAGSHTFSTLYAFSGLNDGGFPHGSLTLDSAGNLYGTASITKDPTHYGTVFEFNTSTSAFTTLHTFLGTDGSTPVSALVFDPSGDILGTTPRGGKFNRGTLFEIAAGTGTFSTLYSFTGALDGATPVGNLTFDAAGNLFGSTSTAGRFNAGTLFELPAGSTTPATSALAPTILASFPGGIGPNSPHAALTVDAAGTIFGTTYFGGTRNLGTVFSFSPATSTFTVLHSFLGRLDGARPSTGLIFDASGDIISTAAIGGLYNRGTVFALLPTIPAAATHLSITTQPPRNIATQPFTSPIVVKILDATNALVTSDASSVTLTLVSGPLGGTLSGTTTVPAVAGIATFNNLIVSKPGTYTLRASDGLLTTIVSAPFAAVAAHLAFTTQPPRNTAGIPFLSPVVIKYLDPANNLVPTFTNTVTLSLASGPLGGVLSGTLTLAALGGIVTFNNLTVSIPGTYTLRASDGLLLSLTSSPFLAT